VISVVVPLDPGRARGKPWGWLQARYALLHPAWEVVLGFCHGPWSKGAAVAQGLSRASGEVIVIADADSWCAQAVMVEAVELARSVPWVMPHETVERLDAVSTRTILDRPPGDIPRGCRSYRHDAPVGGGIVVARREVLEDVPLDPRLLGWGGDDIALGFALDTLVGRHVNLGAALWHLDHRPQANRRRAFPATEALANRYAGAVGDPIAMRILVEEARARLRSLSEASALETGVQEV
jgi:hypothetical protein